MDLSYHRESSEFPALAGLPEPWPFPDREATPRAPCGADRHGKLLRQAWSELAAMKLAEAVATIATIEAECGPLPMASAGLQCALLHAISVALNDDARTAARLVENALKTHQGRVVHPAAAFLLRLGHWKARRLDAFCQLSASVSHAPARRRDALWSILHLSMEASVEAEQLRLASAGRLAGEALELARRFYGPDFAGGRLAASLSAQALYEQDQIDAADRLVRDRLVLSASQGGIEGALGAYVVGSRIATARGQLPFAILLLREAELLGEDRGWPRLVAASLAERVRLFVEEGRMSEAEACARRLAQMPVKSAVEANDYLLARHAAVARARVELAQGTSAQSLPSLRRFVSESLQRRECHVAVEVLMLLACALRAAGQDDEAAAQALRGIELGGTAGLYRTFLDGGEAIRHLLRWLYERRVDGVALLGALRPYVRNLLAGFSERPQQSAAARTRHRSGESLSPRERHIVTLMSHGLSNKRIARQLGIAPETVKSHAKHILLKLAAQTRVEAVSRAMSMGMI
ncbi:MAG: ATP-dependent transcriptional regulator, MalT-like, LuxR family [Ramlibacter sp.]|nr:ATP-dependent transcriptional regulator, MalT-like, LuxR family [Ramlibacter sp.]